MLDICLDFKVSGCKQTHASTCSLIPESACAARARWFSGCSLETTSFGDRMCAADLKPRCD